MARPTQVTRTRQLMMQVILWGSLLIGMLVAAGVQRYSESHQAVELDPPVRLVSLEYRLPQGWHESRSVDRHTRKIYAQETVAGQRMLTITHGNRRAATTIDELFPEHEQRHGASEPLRAPRQIHEGDSTGTLQVMAYANIVADGGSVPIVIAYTFEGKLSDGSFVGVELLTFGRHAGLRQRDETLLLDIIRQLRPVNEIPEESTPVNINGQENI